METVCLRFLTVLLVIGNCVAIYLNDQQVEELQSDLKVMNASCPFDHCYNSSRLFDYSPSLNCDCDPKCRIYDTCCMDSPHRSMRPSGYPGQCLGVYPTNRDHVYMIGTCRPGWPDDDVKRLCQADAEVNDDPMLVVPVTGLRAAQVTYRNYFCAVCNSEGEYIRSWNVQLVGPTQVLANSSIIPEMHYDQNLTQWTVKDVNGSYVPVNISLTIPDDLLQIVRNCRSGMISDCPAQWTDDVVRSKCRSYLSRIYVKAEPFYGHYQNPHCAFCHGEDLSQIRCNIYGGYGSGGGGLKDVMFVGLFVMDDEPKCSGDKVYDKFSKKCRTFRCPSKQKVQNGKCVD